MGTIAGKPETADKTPGFEAGWEMVGGRRAGNANGDAEPGRDQRFALWHSQNAARGAESHANADFLRAAGDVVPRALHRGPIEASARAGSPKIAARRAMRPSWLKLWLTCSSKLIKSATDMCGSMPASVSRMTASSDERGRGNLPSPD